MCESLLSGYPLPGIVIEHPPEEIEPVIAKISKPLPLIDGRVVRETDA